MFNLWSSIGVCECSSLLLLDINDWNISPRGAGFLFGGNIVDEVSRNGALLGQHFSSLLLFPWLCVGQI